MDFMKSIAIRPVMMVPCQLLSVTSQSLNSGLLAFSLLVTQSPGSEGSASRPLP